MRCIQMAYGCYTKFYRIIIPVKLLCLPAFQHNSAYHKLLEQSRDGNKILFTALILAILSSIIVVFLLKEKYKKEKLLATYITETRIARKLHDEIANELYSTILLVNNNKIVSGTKKEQLLEQLDNIYKNTRDISRQNNEVDTGPDYPVQLRLMLKMYGSENVRILIKGLDDINWSRLSNIQKITTFRILQELMVNMKKHSEATLVLVDIKDGDNTINISYSDNGVGAICNDDAHKYYLLGIKNRLADINGAIIPDTEKSKGFSISFCFTM